MLPVPGYGAYGQVTARQPAVPSVARRSVPDSGTPRTCMPGAGCYRPLYASSACVAGVQRQERHPQEQEGPHALQGAEQRAGRRQQRQGDRQLHAAAQAVEEHVGRRGEVDQRRPA